MSSARGRWADAGIAVSILLTALTGAAAAWLDIYFQFFGTIADRADYETAVRHLTGVGVGLAVLTTLVVVGLRRSRWLLVWGWLCAVALGAAALRVSATAAAMPPPDGAPARWIDGAAIMLVPTGWPLDFLALATVVVLVDRALRRSDLASRTVREPSARWPPAPRDR